MAGTWDALILNEYEAVMPLTWRKKWGISYLYQPAFTQQLGIFFPGSEGNEIVKAFLKEAISRFKFIEINLNYFNPPINTNGSFTSRNNFVLELSRTYQDLQQSYPSLTVRHLKRAGKANLTYELSTDYLSVLEMYKKLYSERMPHLTQDDYYNFSSVCKKLSEENNLVVRRVVTEAGELLAAGVFLIDHHRLYNMNPFITPQGKKVQAKYFLFDQLIKEFSNSKYLLDFEGSDIAGIADFYNRFVPENQPYQFFKINNLPTIIKFFKR